MKDRLGSKLQKLYTSYIEILRISKEIFQKKISNTLALFARKLQNRMIRARFIGFVQFPQYLFLFFLSFLKYILSWNFHQS